MTESCVSELLIDRLLAGELAPAAAETARGHASGCTRCRDLLAQAEAVAAQFAAQPPPLRLPGRPRSLVAGVTGLAGVTGAIAAAAVVVAIVVSRGEPRGVRTKGPAAVGFFVMHDGALRRGQSGEVVAPADRLQLVATTDRPAWIAVTGVDATGARAVYGAPQPLAAGRDHALPFSIILDDTPGRSTIAAVFCPGPFALDRPPADCTTDSFTIETRR